MTEMLDDLKEVFLDKAGIRHNRRLNKEGMLHMQATLRKMPGEWREHLRYMDDMVDESNKELAELRGMDMDKLCRLTYRGNERSWAKWRWGESDLVEPNQGLPFNLHGKAIQDSIVVPA